jgi:hypothetical protein
MHGEIVGWGPNERGQLQLKDIRSLSPEGGLVQGLLTQGRFIT